MTKSAAEQADLAAARDVCKAVPVNYRQLERIDALAEINEQLNHAVEIAKIGRPYRSYPGTGGIWSGKNEQMADGNFVDWGLARATAEILNAVVEGRLVPADDQRLRKALEAASGYLMNARIDLTTGCTKATAVQTIDGGLTMIKDALTDTANAQVNEMERK